MGSNSIFGFPLYDGPSIRWYRVKCKECNGEGCVCCNYDGYHELTETEYIRHLEQQAQKNND